MKSGEKLAMSGAFLAAMLFCAAARAEGATRLFTRATWSTVPATEASNPALPVHFFASPPASFTRQAISFFRENAVFLGLNLPEVKLTESSASRSGPYETLRFRKTWKGLEVVGGDSLVSLLAGRVVLANADGTPLTGISPVPKVSISEARALAFVAYAGHAASASEPVKEILLTGQLEPRLPRLAYAVTVNEARSYASEVHHVDALTGAELLVTSNEQPLSHRRVLEATGSADDFLVITDPLADQRIVKEFPAIYGEECAPPAPCTAAASGVTVAALDAWANSGLVYDYYASVHARDSIDGAGLPIRSVVNFGGSQFKNAAWFRDQRVMLYGNGDDSRFNHFSSALDVVAHEITHGVTASTSALVYSGQPGALNESYSDVFGKLVAFRNGASTENWKLGRALFKNGTSFVRDMENPVVALFKDLKYQGQDCNHFNDFCGVHENSGVPSKAAVQIAKRIGTDRFAKLYYFTLTQLLRTSSDFHEARAQTEAACAALFGAGSSDCAAVSEEFTAVGIE